MLWLLNKYGIVYLELWAYLLNSYVLAGSHTLCSSDVYHINFYHIRRCIMCTCILSLGFGLLIGLIGKISPQMLFKKKALAEVNWPFDQAAAGKCSWMTDLRWWFFFFFKKNNLGLFGLFYFNDPNWCRLKPKVKWKQGLIIMFFNKKVSLNRK